MRHLTSVDQPLGFGKYHDQTLRQIERHHPDYAAWLRRENVITVDPEPIANRQRGARRSMDEVEPVRDRFQPSAFEDVDDDHAQRYHEGRSSRPERDPSLLDVINSVPNYPDLIDEAVEDALHDMYDGSGRD